MANYYDELLKELRADESSLSAQLEELRRVIPVVVGLKKRRDAATAMVPRPSRFAGMGARKAVQEVLSDSPGIALTREEIHDRLISGGWTTESDHPLSVVSATLSQMKATVVQKVGEGWRLTLAAQTHLDDETEPEITAADYLQPYSIS